MPIILTNNGVKQMSDLPIEPENSDQSIYEVIRVIDSIALFLEDHFNRLQRSMKIQGISFGMEFQEFRHTIAELITMNRKPEGNIKFEYSIVGNKSRWIFTFIPYSYPMPEDYLKGVRTDLLFVERENPNAKVIQNKVREKANQLISEQKLYEVLLVDRSGLITEGSRSNVFFVKGEAFYTAPESSVLMGITRQKVLECLTKLSFPLLEEAIRADDISGFDAVFLTGTSPKILPVRSIGNQIFRTEAIPVRQLIERYNNLIDQYLQSEQSSLKKND